MSAQLTNTGTAGQDQRLRQNNFDLLRFAFAFVVLLVHAHANSGAQELAVFTQYLSSGLAVKAFFVVSGFLIFMSYENSRSVSGYFGKRIRRIYPAYAFVILASALLGGVFSSYGWADYFSVPLLKYVAANLLFLNFLQPELPGLFEQNPLHAVNGALWTLKIEVMFYCVVPLAVMAFSRLGRLPVLVAMYVGSVAYFEGVGALAAQSGSDFYLELQRQLPGQLRYFVAGAAAYYYFQQLSRYAFAAGGGCIGCVCGTGRAAVDDRSAARARHPGRLRGLLLSASGQFRQIRRFLLRHIYSSFANTAVAGCVRTFRDLGLACWPRLSWCLLRQRCCGTSSKNRPFATRLIMWQQILGSRPCKF